MGLQVLTLDGGWVGVSKSDVLDSNGEPAEAEILNGNSERYDAGDTILVHSSSRIEYTDLETLQNWTSQDIDCIIDFYETGYFVKTSNGEKKVISFKDLENNEK